MKQIFALVFVLVSVSVGYTQSSASDLDNLIKGSAADANYLVKGYATPALNTIGFGLNQSWYNTAATHKLGGFDVTFSTSGIYFPTSDLTSRVENSQLKNLSLKTPTPVNGAGDVPTIFGSETAPVYNFKDPTTGTILPTTTPGLAGFDLRKKGFAFVPVPMVQVGIGLPKGFEVKVRFFPSTDLGGGASASLLGFGLVHDIKQFIPGLKKLPFDLSIFGGYTALKIGVSLDSSQPNNKANFESSATTIQALISKKIAVVTFYGGLGYNFNNTSLAMLGTYDTGVPVNPLDLSKGNVKLTDPVNYSVSLSGARFTAGMRLKFAFFTLHGDYTIQKYDALTVGLGFSFR